MWADRVSNPGPLALESDVLLTMLRGPAISMNGLLGDKFQMYLRR